MKRRILAAMALLAALVAGPAASACTGEACANGLVYEAFGPPPGSGQPVLERFLPDPIHGGIPKSRHV
jgi:hypothetical protein